MAHFKALLFLFACFLLADWASSHMISREVLSMSSSRGRILSDDPEIQKCGVDFAQKDYSSLNACNAPFPMKECCDGFKEIACPNVKAINNLRTDCATSMFIGIYDNKPDMPEDYFVKNCIEGPEGLDCLPILQREAKLRQEKHLQHGTSTAADLGNF